MRKRCEGKVVAVTGGTSGVGRDLGVLLAEEGAKVCLAGRREALGREAVNAIESRGGEAHFVVSDLRKPEDCRRIIDETINRFGRIDGLVNNAGIFPRGDLLETDEELWDEIMDVDLKAPFLLCRAAIPHMIRQGGGSVVNIGSVNAYIGGERLLAYSTAKGGLMTMTKNLARRHAGDRVRVNLVNPGWILTEGEHAVQTGLGKPEDWAERAAETLPMGRLLSPRDVSLAILYFLSDESSMVNGAVLTVEQSPVS